ncbi:MAG: DUF4328 domain-containing protein [Polyangia bacterium]
MDDFSPLSALDSMPAAPPAPLRPTRALSRVVIALVGVYVFANALQVAIMSVLRTTLGSGEPLSPLLTQLDQIQTQLPLIESLLYVSSGVCFLVLVSRLVANLPLLGSKTLLTPTSAVWSFLIPIVNIVGGYSTTRTIWTESQPATQDTLSPRSVPLLGFWWAAYIILGISGRILGMRTNLPAGYTIEQWSTASYLSSMHSAVEMTAGVLFMCVVYLLDGRQNEQHEDLTRRVPVAMASDLLR